MDVPNQVAQPKMHATRVLHVILPRLRYPVATNSVMLCFALPKAIRTFEGWSQLLADSDAIQAATNRPARKASVSVRQLDCHATAPGEGELPGA